MKALAYPDSAASAQKPKVRATELVPEAVLELGERRMILRTEA